MAGGKLMWQGYATWETYAGKQVIQPSGPKPEVYFPVTGIPPNESPITDPRTAIIDAIAKCSAAGGGTVYVGCDYPGNGDAFELSGTAQINLVNVSNVVIDFGGAKLRRVGFDPDPAVEYWPMVRLENCSNVTILNLRLDGNRRGNAEPRSADVYNGGQTAPNRQEPLHGVSVLGCRDIVLRNVHVEESLMDGFLIGYSSILAGAQVIGRTNSERILLESCSARRSFRNGLSVTGAVDVVVRDSAFIDNGNHLIVGETTKRAAYHGPACGVGAEADPAPTSPPVGWLGVPQPSWRSLRFENCQLEGNGGYGAYFTNHEAPHGALVEACHFFDNGRRGPLGPEPSAADPDPPLTHRCHLLVSAPGVEVRGCVFRPVLTWVTPAQLDPENPPPPGPQAALVMVKVQAEDAEWQHGPTRLIGNRFYMVEDFETPMHEHAKWRFAIALHGGLHEGVPNLETHISENLFVDCFAVVNLAAPNCRFQNNVVVGGVVPTVATGGQEAIVVDALGRSVRIEGNRFEDVPKYAIRVGGATNNGTTDDASGLVIADNHFVWQGTGPSSTTAVSIGNVCGGRVTVENNQFHRPAGATSKRAVEFLLTAVNNNAPTGVEARVAVRSNRATGGGWTTGGIAQGPWWFAGAGVDSAVMYVMEASGNQPPLPGEAVTQPGRGLRLTAPDTSFASAPGTLWYDTSNDTPMFRTQGGDQSLLAGTMSGPASATDNALARFDGTTGQVVQNSTVSVDDSGNMLLSSATATLRFGATGGGTRGLRAESDGLYVEDTNILRSVVISSGAVRVAAAQGNVQLEPSSAVQVRDGSTTWASFTTSTQRLGVGTSAPSYRVHVESNPSQPDAVVYVNQADTGASGGGIRVRIATAIPGGGNRFVRFNNGANSVIGRIAGDGTGGVVYVTTSDRALKRDIRPAEGQLARVLALRVSEYATHAAPDRRQIGLIAQEAALVCPEAASDPAELNARQLARVRGAEGAEERRVVDEAALAALRADPALEVVEARPLTETDPEYERWGLDYGRLTPTLAGAIQEQHVLVQAQAAEITALQATVAALVARIEALERR